AAGCRRLADVGDRAGPDGDHAAGPGGGRRSGRDRRLVRVYVAACWPDDHPPDGKAVLQGFLDDGTQIPAVHRHRPGRGEHRYVTGGAAEPGDEVGEGIQGARARGHPPDPERVQAPTVRGFGQVAAEAVDVETGCAVPGGPPPGPPASRPLGPTPRPPAPPAPPPRAGPAGAPPPPPAPPPPRVPSARADLRPAVAAGPASLCCPGGTTPRTPRVPSARANPRPAVAAGPASLGRRWSR